MGVLHPMPVVLPANDLLFPNVPLSVRNMQPGIRNTEPVGVLIDRIVFAINGGNVPATSLITELRWGNEPLTNGFVSVSAVGWPQNRLYEFNDPSSVVVKLDRPFYLPPGDYIDVAIRNDFFPSNAATSISVMAIGRQAPEPAERWIPYLTAYRGPLYQAGQAIADQSNPNDLGNPFNVPLSIERMIGRVLISNGTVFSDYDPDQQWMSFGVKLSDHRDNFWVAQATPFPLVFNTVDRSWLLNHEMEAKGFLRLEFEALGAITQAALAVVGLVGYRRIS